MTVVNASATVVEGSGGIVSPEMVDARVSEEITDSDGGRVEVFAESLSDEHAARTDVAPRAMARMNDEITVGLVISRSN
jgi:hypothetical protein